MKRRLLTIAGVLVAATTSVLTQPALATGASGSGVRHGQFSSSTRINNPYFVLFPETTYVYKGVKDGQAAWTSSR